MRVKDRVGPGLQLRVGCSQAGIKSSRAQALDGLLRRGDSDGEGRRRAEPDVGDTVAPGTPPLGPPWGFTVMPQVGTSLVGVMCPRWGRDAPGGAGLSRRDVPQVGP